MAAPGSVAAAGRRWRPARALALALAFAAGPAGAFGPLDLAVSVPAPPARTRDRFEALAEYLGTALARPVRLVVSPSALVHWEDLRRGAGAAIVIEEAHFADYRAKRFGYRIVAKLPGVTAYALVTAPGRVVVDLDELDGRRIASVAAPAFAPLRLLAVFTDPVRAPVLSEAPSYEAALGRLLAGGVAGALVPSALVAAHPGLNPVLTTEEGPNPAVSVSPALDDATRERVRRALLDARASPAGRRALARLGIDGFEPAGPALYDGFARLLRGTWGYAANANPPPGRGGRGLDSGTEKGSKSLNIRP